MAAVFGKIRNLSYPRIFALGYLLMILLGTALLCLPCASKVGNVSFLDALFTSTSATCVTGLVVADTFLSWSLFGQIVILCLIQIGGLGFMSMVVIASFFLKKRIGLKTRDMLRESINSLNLGGIVGLFRLILLGTIVVEGVGAILLASRFVPMMGWGNGIYYGIFHSVSAFCNAGFDLMGRYGAYSSLVPFAQDPVVLCTVAALIIIGGIGFFVWKDILDHGLHFCQYRFHSKIVLSATAFLLLVPTVLFLLFEWNATLSGMPVGSKILNAFFAAVTPRTAGFNAVSLSAMAPASKMLTTVLMLIGGSPGSTAGGIKTTTIVVLMISMWSSFFNREEGRLFHRRFEKNAVRRAAAVMMLNLFLVTGVSLMLLGMNPGLTQGDVFYETFSAMSTVGLSLGVTAAVSSGSRLLLVLLMYMGRVGSLTFMMAFTEQRMPDLVKNPEEKISIG